MCRAASVHLPSPETTKGAHLVQSKGVGGRGAGGVRGWRSLITDPGEMTSLR